MGAVTPQQEAEIDKAVRHLRLAFREPRCTSTAARLTPWRGLRFRRIFRRVTGERLLNFVDGLRAEKAREMLRLTSLSLGELAHELGFRSERRFRRAFRSSSGVSASHYRGWVGAPRTPAPSPAPVRTEPTMLFSDDFTTRRPEWRTYRDVWKWGTGFAIGEGVGGFGLSLAVLLPDSFRISFRIRVAQTDPEKKHALEIQLTDPQGSLYSYSAHLGFADNFGGRIQSAEGTWVADERAKLSEERDHLICVAYEADTLRLLIDGAEVLAHREAFPPPYATRCRFALQLWAGRLEIRDFALVDLGTRVALRSPRVGDALLRNGLASKAQRFYTELLESGEMPDSERELLYKIGVTHLALGDTEKAEEWFARAADFPGIDPWSRRARLDLVRARARSRRTEEALVFARNLIQRFPRLSDDVAQALAGEAMGLKGRGYCEAALALLRESLEIGREGAHRHLRPDRAIVECLLELRRNDEAFDAVRAMLAAPIETTGERVHNLRWLSSIATRRGRYDEADSLLREAESMNKNPVLVPVLVYTRAAILRGRGRHTEVLDLLDAPRGEREQNWIESSGDVLAERVQTLLALGRTTEARELIRRADAAAGETPGGRHAATLAALRYAPWALDGRFSDAFEILRPAYLSDFLPPRSAAHAALVAGILLELAGKEARAFAFFAETQRRFPTDRTHGTTATAAALAGTADLAAIEEHPAEPYERSELHYWAGRLFEKRRDPERARRFYRLAVDGELTRRWPAELARGRLAVGE